MNLPKLPMVFPTADFSARLTTLLKHSFQSAADALDNGVCPFRLLEYARGRVTDDALQMVASSPWATARVVALVKSARNPLSIGSQILRATDTDPYAWGIENTGDEVMDLARLLEKLDDL